MYRVNYYHSNPESFFTSSEPEAMKGVIDYLRGDFDCNGTGFYTTWFDHNLKLKTEEFKKEFDDVINELREGILKDRESLRSAIHDHPKCRLKNGFGVSSGVFVESEHYEYSLRLIGNNGDYDFYCYCADKRFREPQCRNGRRFRDENGEVNQRSGYIAKVTLPEALNYYINGDRYECNGKEYIFRRNEENMLFEGNDGERIFVVPDNLGTFLPDVASEGMAFVKIPLNQTLSSLTLRDLIQSAGFENIHLVHADEEIDIATIVELNNNILTQEGKAEWADILDARVDKIYEGAYGVQLECSGVDAQRLSEFSYMLAGQCSGENYDKWINSDENQEQNMSM